MARDVTEAMLLAWEQIEQADNARLIVSELITNAVKIKPYGKVALHLALREAAILIEVEDQVPIEPTLLSPSVDDVSGRGLVIVTALADECGSRRTPHG